MKKDILEMSAENLAKALQNREISALEVCDTYCACADVPHAFLTKSTEYARQIASNVDAKMCIRDSI